MNYTLVESKDTSMWGCKDNCIYTTYGGGMVCFKAGELPVTCQDGENELEKDYTEIWTATGEVPNKLAKAPPAPLYMSYNGKKISPNDTVPTDDMLDWPMLKWKAEEGALYTIILIDFGITRLEGLQFMHWIMANVQDGDKIKEGDEISEYLAPFVFTVNEDGTDIDKTTGTRGHDIMALVYKQNTGMVNMTDEARSGCDPSIGKNFGDHVAIAEKYNMELVAGNFFFTTYTPSSTDPILCFMTKCTGEAFPIALPGINDGDDCKQ